MSLPSTDTVKIDYRNELAARIRGQTMTVQDIRRIYDDWTLHPHPATDVPRQDLEDLFRVYLPTEDEREKARKVGSAYCAGVVWTGIPTEKFMVLGRWMGWVFFWDHEIDCGLLSHNSDKTNAYIDDSIAFIWYYLLPELKTPPPVPGRLHNCGP
jgi:hypothetical protein